MKNLDLQKAANDLAFETVTLAGPAVDAAIAAKATELGITDPQYVAFKSAVNQFRSIYARAGQQDAAVAQASPPVVLVPAVPPPNA